MQRLILAVIARYRVTGGGLRWFGVDCNFEPSCSAYAEEAIARFGLCRGLVLTWGRIRACRRRDSPARCLDPVPEVFEGAESGRR